MNNYKLCFFDFECFRYDWLVVIIDYETRKRKVIINNVEELRKMYDWCKKHGYIWVGYNCRGYDAPLLKCILCGMDAWEVNQKLINERAREYTLLTKEQREQYPLLNFDMSDKFHSLKQYEGFMGEMIKESDVDFTIDRKLTDAEIEETIFYCTHDVEQTIKVFEAKPEEFETQSSLIEAFDLPLEDFNRTKAQLVAKILQAEMQPHKDEWELIYPDTLKIGRYQNVLDWFKNPDNHDTSKSLYTTIGGIPHVIGWGGIHGCVDNFQYEGRMLCADVASLYPSIMIEYGLLSRNVKHPELYRQIRDRRLELKKAKNPLQKPYKIVLNSTYGASGDKHNPLFDPRMAHCVCLTGQLLLIDLIDKLEDYCHFAQTNTDGVYIYCDNEADEAKCMEIMDEWQQRTRLQLEVDVATKLIQKDVNNYFLVEEDGVKTKGAYIKKLSTVDYDLPILNKALNAYFADGTAVEDTINDCDSLMEFQKIIKIGGSYGRVQHGDKVLREKVHRVFASTREDDAGLFKFKDGGNAEKLGGTSEHCFICNDEVKGKSCPDYLDKEWYIKAAKDRLNDFFEGKGKSKIKNEIKGVSNEIKTEIEQINEQKPYQTFLDLLFDISNLQCGLSQLTTLVKVGKLSNYGNAGIMLYAIELYDKFGKRKTIKVVDAEELGLDKLDVVWYNKRSDKTISGIDNRSLIMALLKRDGKQYRSEIVDTMKWQIEILGSTKLHDGKRDPTDWLVLATDTNKFGTTYATLYNICYGASRQYRANKQYASKHPLEVGSIIKAVFQERDKVKKVNDVFVKTGEKIVEIKCWKTLDK